MTTKTKMTTVPSVARMMKEIRTPEGFERTTSETWYAGGKEWPVLKLESPDVSIEIVFTPQRDPYRKDGYDLGSGHVTFKTSAGERTFDRYGVEDSFYVDNPLQWKNDRLWEGTRVSWLAQRLLGTILESPGYRSFGPDRADSWEDRYTILWDNGNRVDYTESQRKRAGIVRADVIEQVNATIKHFLEVKIPQARARIDKSEHVPGLPFMVTAEDKERITKTLKRGEPHRFMPSGFGTGYTLSRRGTSWSRPAGKELERFFGVHPLHVETFDAD